MTSTQILIYSLLTSLKIVLIYASFQEGMIMFPVKQWIETQIKFEIEIGDKIYKPIWGCLTCMCSFWGFILWLIAGKDILTWDFIWCIMVTGGINFILDNTISFCSYTTIFNDKRD